jgi:hypothetical protein
MGHPRRSRKGPPEGMTASSRKAAATAARIRSRRGEQHDGEQSGGT